MKGFLICFRKTSPCAGNHLAGAKREIFLGEISYLQWLTALRELSHDTDQIATFFGVTDEANCIATLPLDLTPRFRPTSMIGKATKLHL